MISFWRHISNAKTYWIIALSGLVIAVTVALLITSFIVGENSYDQWNSNSQHKARLQMTLKPPGSPPIELAGAARPLRLLLESNYTNLVEAVTYFESIPGSIRIDDKNYNHTITVTDQHFFSIFNAEFTQQSNTSPISSPGQVAIAHSLAEQLFPNKSALGQSIIINSTYSAVIDAVYKDFPQNSHYRPEVVFHTSDPEPSSFAINDWMSISGYIYILLKENSSIQEISTQFESLLNNNIPGADTLGLQPSEIFNINAIAIDKIHTQSNAQAELSTPADTRAMKSLGILALLIVLLALINFNIATLVSSSARQREAAIRRCIGESKVQMVLRQLGENLFLCILAACLAFALAATLLPFAQKQIGSLISFSPIYQLEIILFLLIFIAAATLITSIAPIRNNLLNQSINALRAVNESHEPGKQWFHQITTAINLLLALTVLSFTLVVFFQHRYMQDAASSFNNDEIIIFKDISRIESLGEEFPLIISNLLRQYPLVSHVSGSSSHPGASVSYRQGVSLLNQAHEQDYLMDLVAVEPAFQATLDLQLLAGRWFDDQRGIDLYQPETERMQLAGSVLINESAAAALGLTAATSQNQRIAMNVEGQEQLFDIIGVYKDVHWQGYHVPINPTVLLLWPNNSDHLIIRVDRQNRQAFLQQVDEYLGQQFPAWNAVRANVPKLELQQLWDSQYRTEAALLKILLVSAVATLILALSGILILAARNSQREKKSWAIRRILGEPLSTSLLTTLRPYLLVSLLVLLFTPILLNTIESSWLTNYAYHIEINALHFVLLGLVIIILSLLASLQQFYLTRKRPPAETLRLD